MIKKEGTSLEMALAEAKAEIESIVGGRAIRGQPLSEHHMVKLALEMVTYGSAIAVDSAQSARVVKWGVWHLAECADGCQNGLDSG